LRCDLAYTAQRFEITASLISAKSANLPPGYGRSLQIAAR
jgi:TrmH family RNA methyltransferase